MSKDFFNFKLEPGEKITNKNEYKKKDPVISIITPFYNDKNYIKKTINCVINQTFPYFEMIIVDDGSQDEESLKVLDEVSRMDERIKVFHKENEGPAATRDYGVNLSSNSAKYLFFLDSDDLINETYLECAYWTLETNPGASWAYTDSVGFFGNEYTWNKWFDSMKMKKENELVATALIRKEDFLEVGGYEIREKSVSEDWNLWLKMLARGMYPVRMNFYGFWYRIKKNEGEHNRAKGNKERDLSIIQKTAKTIKKKVKAVQYPKYNYNWDILDDKVESILQPELINKPEEKINILMIIPWMTTGGADKFNIDLIKGLDKDKFSVTVITTEPQVNNYRQDFEKYATVYDLTTFLDQKYWLSFIKYIIEARGINFVLNTNSRFGYASIPYIKGNYPDIPIIDYIHMEEWYNRNGGYSRDSKAVESLIDKTLVCNQNSEKILAEHFGRNPEELDTVYIGVDENVYDPATSGSKERILKKYKINNYEGKKIISFICRIAAQKRPHLLIQIVKKLKEYRNDFLVVVAGDGDMLDSIKKEASKFGLTENMSFIGNVKETKNIYAISDMTLNCSIKEGLALTAYESLAMGVPVVSADVGGQAELINDEVGAIVPCLQREEDIMNFNYSDEEVMNYVVAIEKVLDNLDDYKGKCRNRILSGFTIDQMVKNMSDTIVEIFNNPSMEKIENGAGLSNNISMTKELVTFFLQSVEKEYVWQCDQYNLKYFEIADAFGTTKWSKTKERLWTHSSYRFMIKVLQKFGLTKFLRKILRRNKEK